MNNNQLNLLPVQLDFDAYAADLAKQDALTRVAQNADADWKTVALECVKTVAARQAELTTDDIWQELARYAIGTHENRALGPVMNAAHRAGFITPTARYVNCERVSRHKAPIRVWQSRLKD